MKTKLVRPVFVKIDTKDSLISDRNILTLSDGKIYNPFKNEYYQLILICLDGKIEVGDMVFRWNWFNDIITCDKELLVAEEHGLRLSKVIATQPQLSPDLINQLVAEYNNGVLSDFEIVMICFDELQSHSVEFAEMWKNNSDYKPKLTNGFVTFINKEPNAAGICDECNCLSECTNEPLCSKVNYTEEEVWKLLQDMHLDFVETKSKINLKDWFIENKKK